MWNDTQGCILSKQFNTISLSKVPLQQTKSLAVVVKNQRFLQDSICPFVIILSLSVCSLLQRKNTDERQKYVTEHSGTFVHSFTLFCRKNFKGQRSKQHVLLTWKQLVRVASWSRGMSGAVDHFYTRPT